MSYLKNDQTLIDAPLAPQAAIQVPPGGAAAGMARVYNRLGGLIRRTAAKVGGMQTAAALAAWHVESGGAELIPGLALIRFECHRFYKYWGSAHTAQYDKHFQHGGHAGVAGEPYQNHKFRKKESDEFESFHGDQSKERRALAWAITLADEETAFRSASIGGPQIMMDEHSLCGYATASEMYYAFQESERWHVLGFFDFCAHKNAPSEGQLIAYIGDKDWENVARYYNGPANVASYAPKFASAYDTAVSLGV